MEVTTYVIIPLLRWLLSGLSTEDLQAKVTAVEKTLNEEKSKFNEKKAAFRQLERKRDHALSALQVTKKKVHYALCTV